MGLGVVTGLHLSPQLIPLVDPDRTGVQTADTHGTKHGDGQLNISILEFADINGRLQIPGLYFGARNHVAPVFFGEIGGQLVLSVINLDFICGNTRRKGGNSDGEECRNKEASFEFGKFHNDLHVDREMIGDTTACVKDSKVA